MGASVAYTFYGSIGASGVAYAAKQIPVLHDGEEIQSIEERCWSLDNPLKIFGGRHSFLIARTWSGRVIRYDYFADAAPRVLDNYVELQPNELFRKGSAKSGITVSDLSDLFKNQWNSKPYDLFRHNWQHVARDIYSQVTDESNASKFLRNDFLHVMSQHSDDERFQHDTRHGLSIHEPLKPNLSERLKEWESRKDYKKHVTGFLKEWTKKQYPEYDAGSPIGQASHETKVLNFFIDEISGVRIDFERFRDIFLRDRKYTD